MKIWLAICVLLLFCLIACTPKAVTPSPSNPPTGTASPTFTQTVGPSPRPSKSPSPTISPATVSARKTLFAAPVVSCNSNFSPDHEWTILTCDHGDTKVSRNDGSASWEVPFYEKYGMFYGIKDGTMGLQHWSKDNQFAYFIPYFCCLDVPESDFFNDFRLGPALYRLNLNSGKITTTLPPDLNDMVAGYSFAFSPNDKYLVYDGPHSALSLYELKTGKTEEIDLGDEYLFYGRYNWSADSKQLAFIAFHSISTQQSAYSYFVMNISDLASTRLMEKSQIYDFTWTDPALLTLTSADETLDFDLALTPTP